MGVDAQTFWLENLQTASNYNQWIFSQIRPFLGDDVLEVGCGNGNFSVFLAQHCQKFIGLDLDERYVQIAQQRLEPYSHATALVADATQVSWNHAFDSIVALDVLEHIEDDIGTLQKLGHCLKPGGQLIIKVPALQSLYTPMDRAIGHYRRYHKKSLARVFSQANFARPRLWYFNLAGIPGWWLNGKVLQRTVPPSSQVGLFDKVVPVLQQMEAIAEPPVGLSLFAVATKL